MGSFAVGVEVMHIDGKTGSNKLKPFRKSGSFTVDLSTSGHNTGLHITPTFPLCKHSFRPDTHGKDPSVHPLVMNCLQLMRNELISKLNRDMQACIVKPTIFLFAVNV